MDEGFLPGTRPLAGNYGPALLDSRPVERTDRELSAVTINKMRIDGAYSARMVPVLRTRISNSGSVAPVSVIGPENIDMGSFASITRTSVGLVRVALDPSSGFVVSDARAQGYGSSARLATVNIVDPLTVDVLIVNGSGTPTDADFLLEIY